MANYVAVARTNRFKVKDYDAFAAEINTLGSFSIERRGNPAIDDHLSVTLYVDDDTGAWPAYHYDEATDTDSEIDWTAVISKHLLPGETCVVMEIGNERMRYLIGYAFAIHSDGRRIDLSLSSIYEQAATDFGGTVTHCEY